VTTERLTAIFNGVGVEISKRQVVRLLTSNLGTFAEEDQRVLRAGLTSAPFITVDCTGDRDGRLRSLRCEGVARFDGAGMFLGYTGCNIDVTEATLAAER
jgi:hypothetical protein